MKKLLCILFSVVLLTSMLSGCGQRTETAESSDSATDISSGSENSSESESGSAGTDSSEGSGSTDSSESSDGAVSYGNLVLQSDSDMFTDRDYRTEYDESESVTIQLNGDSAVSSSNSVEISGSTVTITEEATYIITGSLGDGMIIVDAPDTAKLQLVLNGVDINSETSAAIYILEADKVFITLADGSENTLSNGGTFTAIDENSIDGAVFSKQDLTFNGSGSLTVTSPAGHGIVCKDDLVFTGGSYTVTSANHGLDSNDSIRITGDTAFTIDAGKDGMHSENNDDASLGFIYISGGAADIAAEGDGISAGYYMQICGGDFSIIAGGGSVNAQSESSDAWGGFMQGGMPGSNMGGGPGADIGGSEPAGGMGADPGNANPGASVSYSGNSNAGSPTERTSADGIFTSDISINSTNTDDIYTLDASTDGTITDDGSTSMKGLKAAGPLIITDGTFSIDSADDSVHSNTSITVNGGAFDIASGDDAFHADEELSVTAGTIYISECYEGLEALHLDISGGDIDLTASDDGLNAAGGTDASGTQGGRDGMFGGGFGGMSANSDGTIVISGGTIYINASGDGIDANGSIEMTGGYVTIVGPTQGDTATLDYDTTATITGGTFIGTGASTMAQTFSSGEQGVIAVSLNNQEAGSTVIIADSDGNEILNYSPELSFGVIIYSSPEIVSGETYTLTVGSASGEVEAS